ncbi:MAG: hypothetical protein QXL15_02790 [Candidatus Korarchaeota archaeon]
MTKIRLIGGPSLEIFCDDKNPIEAIKEFERVTGQKILYNELPLYHIVMIDGVQLSIFGNDRKLKNVKEVVIIPLIHGG